MSIFFPREKVRTALSTKYGRRLNAAKGELDIGEGRGKNKPQIESGNLLHQSFHQWSTKDAKANRPRRISPSSSQVNKDPFSIGNSTGHIHFAISGSNGFND